MARYAGIKDRDIILVSDNVIYSSDYKILKIPESFNYLSNEDIILNLKYENDFILKNFNRKINEIKIAFVSNWRMNCGISTYAEALYPEIAKHCKDYKIFVEKNNNPTESSISIPDDKIIQCWARGESLTELVNEIKSYNPDIILIQHEFGIFPNARLWLALMTQLSSYRIITTLHSVFHHRDKAIVEAAIPEIVVHLDGAKKVLKEEKLISSKVHVIPHGCYDYNDKEKLWNFYKSKRTFLQFGFGFRYKNWENSIIAASILKKKYNDIFFTGLFSESNFNKNEHTLYYNELLKLIEKLDLQENVSIIRGFQSDNVIDIFLRMNSATVFPYVSNPEHEVFGASGAARFAMSKGIPVITSNVNHFSDIPSIKCDNPEEIANSLEKLFNEKSYREDQIEKQKQYVISNSWNEIAKKYIKIIEG